MVPAPVPAPAPPASKPKSDVVLFEPPPPAGGCASGECLPDAAPPPAAAQKASVDVNVNVNVNARVNGPATAPVPAAVPVPVPAPGPAPATAPVPAAAHTAPPWRQPLGPTQPAVPPPPRAPASVSAPPPAPSAPAPSAPSRRLSDAEQWRLAVEALRQSQPRHGRSLAFGRLISLGDSTVRLAFAADAGFHRATVFDGGRQVIETELQKRFGRHLRLEEETNAQVHAQAPRSLAEAETNAREARESAIDHKVRTHPAVASVLKHLGGRLEHVQVLEAPAPAATDDAPPAPVEDEA